MGKVRRSGRIAKEIRILLLGMDCNGTVFSEETQTVTLSRARRGDYLQTQTGYGRVVDYALFGRIAPRRRSAWSGSLGRTPAGLCMALRSSMKKRISGS